MSMISFAAIPPRYYMRRFRLIYLFLSTSVSLALILLAALTYNNHPVSVRIFWGLIFASILNLGSSLLIKIKILDVLVELEFVLSDSTLMSRNDKTLRHPSFHVRKKPSALETMVEQIEKTINNEYTSQLLRTQAEIHALQSQINPHFLYNTLETIRSQAIVRQVPEIEEMAEALATIFRYGISSQGEMSTLSKELKCADNYLLIQQYRFSGRYQVVKDIDESDEMLMKCKMPILTIQPIIENAIVHGLERKLGQGIVTIRAESTDTHLYIQIYDNGIGMSQETLEKLNNRLDLNETLLTASDNQAPNSGSGIALINVNQRIKHFFGKEYGISVASTIDIGTFVDIVLPNVQ